MAAILLPPLTHSGCGCDCDDQMANYRSVNGEPDTVITHLESAIFRYEDRGLEVLFQWGDMAARCCDVIVIPSSQTKGAPPAPDSSGSREAVRPKQLQELLY
jgi:hypothetical protein